MTTRHNSPTRCESYKLYETKDLESCAANKKRTDPYPPTVLVNRVKVGTDTKFPGVYMLWRGARALYVGVGRDVFKRASKNLSNPRGRVLAYREADTLEIYGCDSFRQAQQLETELIGIYEPQYNFVGHLQSSRNFQQLKAIHSLLERGVA